MGVTVSLHHLDSSHHAHTLNRGSKGTVQDFEADIEEGSIVRRKTQVTLPPEQRDIPSAMYEDSIAPLPEMESGATGSTSPKAQGADGVEFRTAANHFGLYRVYPSGKPTYTPDVLYGDEHLSDCPAFHQTMDRASSDWWKQAGSSLGAIASQKTPPVNKSINLLLEWFWDPTSTTKTYSDADKLVKNVISHPDFSPTDFENYRGTARETETLDKFFNSPESLLPTTDKWIQSSISLPLPCPGFDYTQDTPAPIYEINNLYRRKMLDVIKASLSEPSAKYLHFSGYEEYWRPPHGGPDERVYSEIYNSDAFLRAEESVKKQAAKAGSKLEASVFALQLWSDSTHLADFGTASLWPIYQYPGNITKYIKSRPTTFSANHLAYIPKLGDAINDAYLKHFQRAPQPEVLTHLRRELFQLIWYELIDEEFVKAYNEGFECKCPDGVTRLLFPRILTYSADYPEKTLIACIKTLGNHPCPQCLVTKHEIRELGTAQDLAIHDERYRADNHPLWYDINSAQKRLWKGESITNNWFKEVLARQSIAPTRSALSKRLESDENFQVFQILTPDLLHEIEIGTWKALFTHLVRMLQSISAARVSRLNARYRHTPSFGRGVIRRFANNAADMKRLGARDFEDLLQCAIPAFCNLFRKQSHNDRIRQLLFEFATWHALAKLRRHTETTRRDLRTSTQRLGKQLRYLADQLGPRYLTRELKSEKERRLRTRVRRGLSLEGESAEDGRRRTLNLHTFKIHAMGHYSDAIAEYGTTDNYSTQIGESQHRHVKRWYTRVRKGNATFVGGITRQQRREKALFQLKSRAGKADAKGKGKTSTAIDVPSQLFLPFEYSEKLEQAPAYLHHQISQARRKENTIVLPDWIEENQGDPALKEFIPRLKTHLLLRLLGQRFQGDEERFTATELNNVIIEGQKIYSHKAAWFNYTTYDGRRDQDSVGTRKNSDIMVLAHEDDPSGHGLWYARIVGIFHCRVIHNTTAAAFGVRAKDMEVLWVRWLGLETSHAYGWKAKDLPKVGFIDETQDETMAFGFIDPAEVIRAVHLIPSFNEGKGNNGMPRTIARPATDNNLDWNYFYVNIFVDRDMFMRYRGGGVGHVSTAASTLNFLTDRDPLDLSDEGSEMDVEETEESDIETEEGSDGDGDGEGAEDEDGEEEYEDEQMDVEDGGSDSGSEAELLDEELDFDYDWDDVVEVEAGDLEELEEDLDGLGPEDGKDDEDEGGHEVVGFSSL